MNQLTEKQEDLLRSLIDVEATEKVALQVSELCREAGLNSLEYKSVLNTLEFTLNEPPWAWDIATGNMEKVFPVLAEVARLGAEEAAKGRDAKGDLYRIVDME